MQIYTDANGVQQYTDGVIAIDTDTGLPVLPVLWDVDVDGPIPDLEEVGGYSVVEGELVYSQAAFDDNEALKVTVADAEAAAIVAAKRAAAIELIANGQPSLTDLIAAMRAVLLLTVDEVNILRQCNMVHRGIAASGAVTNIATLKTAMLNNLPTTDDRTLQQAKTALQNKINAGDAD